MTEKEKKALTKVIASSKLCKAGKHVKTESNTRLYTSTNKYWSTRYQCERVYQSPVVWCLDCHNETRKAKRDAKRCVST